MVLETSAKDNTNVEQAFAELATELKVLLKKNFFEIVCNVCMTFLQRNQCGLGIHDAEQQEVFNLNSTRILKSKQCTACST